jgi:hypothetical protein
MSSLSTRLLHSELCKGWEWSGEGRVLSHQIPLKMMKIAVAGEMVLTRSHILLTDIKLSAKVDQPSKQELRKLKKGILVYPETGKCMNNVPHAISGTAVDG